MRARFADAMRAWATGDAERTLTLCDALRPDDAAQADDVALLRARVLLRLLRSREAIALLEDRFAAGDRLERLPAALMLHGTALVRAGDTARGIAALQRAELISRAAPVPLRSEIALGIALGRYQEHDFAAAEAALSAIDPGAGIVYARAAELTGWIAKARNDFPAPVAHFETALARLDRCAQSDRFLEANLIMALGNYAVERLELDRWSALERRAGRIRWDSSGLAYYRFWFEIDRSMASELTGDAHAALQAARSAAACAPSPAFRLFAHCRRAAVLLAYGELLGYGDLAAAIHEELHAIDVAALARFEEINVPVAVAETLALIGDARGARDALARLDAMSAAQIALLCDEPAKRAYLALVEGLVADADGDAFTARHRYDEAFRSFRGRHDAARAARGDPPRRPHR